ncbi:hypothetical protein F5141DRAFT_1065666 [Pisolithus sp. B1]|nr:hypothetical protein F5141DRAFT_1065666 [Pisolithus sp. B1]
MESTSNFPSEPLPAGQANAFSYPPQPSSQQVSTSRHLPPTNPIQAATPAPDTTLPAGHQFLASVSNTFPVTALPVAPAGGTELPNILPVPAAQMEDLTLHNHSKQHLVALDLALLQTNPITLPSAMKVPTTTCGCADVIQETFIALGLGFPLVVIARSGV